MQENRQSLINAFKCAFSGIAYACKTGRNFKIELAIGILAIILSVVCAVLAQVLSDPRMALSFGEWVVIVACIGLVLGGECVNSSIEAVVDLVSPGYNELAGHAKDCAAGAVLLFSIASLAIAFIIFLPRLLWLIG